MEYMTSRGTWFLMLKTVAGLAVWGITTLLARIFPLAA
jgi:hypothetical protein